MGPFIQLFCDCLKPGSFQGETHDLASLAQYPLASNKHVHGAIQKNRQEKSARDVPCRRVKVDHCRFRTSSLHWEHENPRSKMSLTSPQCRKCFPPNKMAEIYSSCSLIGSHCLNSAFLGRRRSVPQRRSMANLYQGDISVT